MSDVLPRSAAEGIATGFEVYQRSFMQKTRCARGRFEMRDWRGHERDSVDRLRLYKRVVDRIVEQTQEQLQGELHRKGIWSAMRAHYSEFIAGRLDIELAETFFNSVTRRVFATIGVDPGIEFVDSDFAVAGGSVRALHRTYYPQETTAALIQRLLCDYPFCVLHEDTARDAERAAALIDRHLTERWGDPVFDCIEMLPSVFYRNKAAYLVGRIRRRGEINPIVIALLNGDHGVFIDAVLLTENDASIVFSYTHSYFHVDTDCPYLLVEFLKSIMPLKRRAELYTSIGYNKHGKTELYRDLYCHLQSSSERFQLARGDRGMVMVVFTMPDFDYVFKVIKDAFPYPKRTTRVDVMGRYNLVFQHDRAGRLIDAQEFEHLAFDRDRFTDEALSELLSFCGNTVSIVGDTVDIRHLYTERRLTPLNVYLREAGEEAAEAAVLEYGQAIKDLAATNIFPGDLFLKNFGVTRHGRVIFYDYDELVLLDQCNFRKIPLARDSYDDFGDAQPWFSVGENDIFPEEFRSFLGLDKRLLDIFCRVHSDLFEVDWWRKMQTRLASGEVMDLFPYSQTKRLHNQPVGGVPGPRHEGAA